MGWLGGPYQTEKEAYNAYWSKKAREKEMDRVRAMRRIRRAVTNALEWHEIASLAGGGNPEHIDWKRYKAKQARDTLERIILEELDAAEGSTSRAESSGSNC